MSGFYATIARYYDSEHYDKDEDLPFYESLIDEAGDPVLIIGSGTGRLAGHLAQAGNIVHGIEVEAAMLERAERKRAPASEWSARLTYHKADALTFSPPGVKFSAAIIPYNTLMHFLTLEDQQTLLRRVRASLTDDGLLILDLPNAGEAFASQDSEAVTLERTFIEIESGHLVMQQSSSRLDRVEQVMSVTWIYDEIGEGGALQRTVVPVEIHYFFYNELRLLLESCGFAVEAVFGDFDATLFMDGAPRMIVLAKAN